MNAEINQQLATLKLSAFKQSLLKQEEQSHLYSDLSFYDRLSLLLSDEVTAREQRRIDRLVKQAKFRLAAHPNQIDYRLDRGLDKSKIRSLLEGHWLTHGQNLIFTGATGCGKTYLACAIGHYFCQQGKSVRYFRLKGLQAQLQQVHGEGTYNRFLNQLTQTKILILDDWGMEVLSKEQRSDLLDIIDARHGDGSMIISSQIPVAKWHGLIGEMTYGDAIMDRLTTRAERFELLGDSMRRVQSNLTEQAQ